MKQICPHCLASVSLPETAAGTEVPCPQCGKPVAVPARYNPVVAAPPPAAPAPVAPVPAASAPVPPPGYISPAPVPTPGPAPAAVAPPPGLAPTALTPPGLAHDPTLPAGYTRSFGVVLSPRVMAWLPAVGLTFALLFTFFPWVTSNFGQHAVYSQGPWRMVTGYPDRDFQLEEAAKQRIPGFGSWLNNVPSNWELMLPFLLLLIAAVLLAWADHLLTAPPPPNRIPPPLRWVTNIWPHRAALLFGLAALALVLVLSQATRGFGIETAVRNAVRNNPDLVEKRKKAVNDQAEQDRLDVEEQQKMDEHRLRRTTWLYLSVGFHILAVVGITARAGLARRGNKPPPRIVVQY
jgi:hypothetical protein